MKQARLNIRINEDLKEEFDRKCEKEMRTSSVVLRGLMKEYILRGQEIFKEDEKNRNDIFEED